MELVKIRITCVPEFRFLDLNNVSMRVSSCYYLQMNWNFFVRVLYFEVDMQKLDPLTEKKLPNNRKSENLAFSANEDCIELCPCFESRFGICAKTYVERERDILDS